jgi:effector-binding domain-containing protein
MTYTVEIAPITPRVFAVARFHIRLNEMNCMSDRIAHAFCIVSDYLTDNETAPYSPAIARYRQFPDGFDVFAGFAVSDTFEPSEKVIRLDVGGCETAHTTHIGTYGNLANAYQAMRTGARVKGRKLSQCLPMWEEYWPDPYSSADDKRTEIFWPVESLLVKN